MSLPVRPTMTDVLLGMARLETKVDGLREDVTEVKSDVETLKERRWPLKSLAALCGIAACCAPFLAQWR